ncbi:unnamed protein product, partial [Trichogramma brassicae]
MIYSSPGSLGLNCAAQASRGIDGPGEAGLTMNIRKCQFLKSSVTYLGLEVSANGIKPGQGKVEAIKRFPVPKNVHEIRRFLGLTVFFRRFVPRYAEIAAPLSGLLKSDREFIWSREVSDAFTALRDKLVERPILQPFNSKKRTEATHRRELPWFSSDVVAGG